MRNFVIAAIFFVSVTSLKAQEPKARLFDEFGRVPCGDMMARLDVLVSVWMENPDERVVVIYYNHRYRRYSKPGKGVSTHTTILSFPHRDDAKNWAQGTPIYLSDRLEDWIQHGKSPTIREMLKKNLVLIDGGFREQISAEIWFVPPGASNPAASPLLKETDVRFGAKTPYRVPRYYHCYDGVG